MTDTNTDTTSGLTWATPAFEHITLNALANIKMALEFKAAEGEMPSHITVTIEPRHLDSTWRSCHLRFDSWAGPGAPLHKEYIPAPCESAEILPATFDQEMVDRIGGWIGEQLGMTATFDRWRRMPGTRSRTWNLEPIIAHPTNDNSN